MNAIDNTFDFIQPLIVKRRMQSRYGSSGLISLRSIASRRLRGDVHFFTYGASAFMIAVSTIGYHFDAGKCKSGEID